MECKDTILFPCWRLFIIISINYYSLNPLFTYGQSSQQHGTDV